MGDLTAALRAILADDAATVTLAGPHIYGGELPLGVMAGGPRAALVIEGSGGTSLTGASDAPVDTQRVDLTAYGATPASAEALLRTASAALRRVKRRLESGVMIHWVNSAGGFAARRDRDGQWPMAFQSFQILHSLEE